jgi:serine O-acetyltransferase
MTAYAKSEVHRMRFWQLLHSDLERQYRLESVPARRVTFLGILQRSLHPRFLPLLLCRMSRGAFEARIPFLPFLFSYLNLIFFGLQITPRCEIGPGLFLPHPVGTVIGAWRIGRNATIFQGATLGAKSVDMAFDQRLLPELGDNVTVGAGAKVLGGITVGNDVAIGANAVVYYSVESSCIVAGNPARVLARSRFEK